MRFVSSELREGTGRQARSDRNFQPGDTGLARTYSGGSCWAEGTVLERSGPVSSAVRVGDTIQCCHDDQLLHLPAAVDDSATEATILGERPKDLTTKTETAMDNHRVTQSPQDVTLNIIERHRLIWKTIPSDVHRVNVIAGGTISWVSKYHILFNFLS